MSEVCRVVRNEVKEICSAKHDSILRMKTKPAVEMFTWDCVWRELEEKVPLLLQNVKKSVAQTARSIDTMKPALCV